MLLFLIKLLLLLSQVPRKDTNGLPMLAKGTPTEPMKAMSTLDAPR